MDIDMQLKNDNANTDMCVLPETDLLITKLWT